MTLTFERQLHELKQKYKDSPYLSRLYYSIKKSIGESHLLIPVLQIVLLYDLDHSGTEQLDSDSGLPARPSILTASNSDRMKVNPLDVGMLAEGGKVIGQNSLRVAGQVIIGVSAAFLVWDAIDLGFSITDLVRKRGSDSAKVLREKAALLESALEETLLNYKVEIV